jgi:DNA-binding beta-propeller fold protein YncE
MTPRRFFGPHFLLLLVLGVSLSLAGCDLVGSDGDDTPDLRTTGVFVGNGGNFSDQNGSLMVYDPATGQTREVATFGAVLQAMRLDGDSLYIVTNTFSGGRINVFDASTVMRTHQVETPSTPRAFAPVSADKAYVTNTSFGSDEFVATYDRTTGQFRESTIPVGTIPADAAVVGDQTYVANYGSGGAGTTLTVIDTASDQATGTVELGCDGPNELFVDEQGELVVVCQGKTVYNDDFTEIIEQTNGQIVFVNAGTGSVVDRIELDRQVGSANGTQTAYYAPTSEELYVLGSIDAVLRFDTATNSAASTVPIPQNEALAGPSAVAYDGASQQLYVARLATGPADGPDFRAAGSVVVLNRDGSEVTTFTVGPAPSHIVLRQETQ